jgi:uncharacterized membrane protein
VRVDRPPGATFAYAENLARQIEWQRDLEAVEVVTPGHVVEGTRAIETRRVAGRRLVNEYEITEHRPPSRLAFRTLNGAIRPEGVMTFEPDGDGTRVSFELVLRGFGLGRLLVPLVRLDARRQVRADLERFAEVMGRGGDAPPGGSTDTASGVGPT